MAQRYAFEEVVVMHFRRDAEGLKLSITLGNEIVDQLIEHGRAQLTGDERRITLDWQGDLPPSEVIDLAELKIDQVGR